MSRIGNQLITIPSGVTLKLEGDLLTVTGPKGTLTLNIPHHIKVEIKDDQVTVSRVSNIRQARASHGTTRAHINNMIQGVVTPWKKELEIRGTGYKASLNGNKLTILAGFIHPVIVTAPQGIEFIVSEETKVSVVGCDKTIVGQVASNIRKIRKPEPYKGKGIRYLDEFIKLKAGKTAKA